MLGLRRKRTNLHEKYDYPMIKKGQLDRPKAQASTAASQFYSLAF